MDYPKNENKSEMLTPPPSTVVPEKGIATQRRPMARPKLGSRGQRISLLSNHFEVFFSGNVEGYFYHHSVSIKYENDTPANAIGNRRRIIEEVFRTYLTELPSQRFAYDGEKSLFTMVPLPQNKLEFTVIMTDVSSDRRVRSGSPNDNDPKRLRRQPRYKTYKVAINYTARIPKQALPWQDPEHLQEAVRVLNIMLRQHAAQQGCLLVRQSFFHDEPKTFFDLGGGALGCRGSHSSFKATQGGLYLNIDVSTTIIVKPGPVTDFLCLNQKVDNLDHIDWAKAKRTLKNLRIKAIHTNMEYKISGLSDLICTKQTFSLKKKREGTTEEVVEITVYDYFVHRRNIELKYSGKLPCINVGKAKRPTYIPIELCSLVSLQRYTKALSNLQRASLVEKSRQTPRERMKALQQVLTENKDVFENLLAPPKILIRPEGTRIEGRVLAAPTLRFGAREEFVPSDGRWNFNGRRLFNPKSLELWVVVNFSAADFDMRKLCEDLIKCGETKGITINQPFAMFQEKTEFRHMSAPIRVEKMNKTIRSRILKMPVIKNPQLILCILPEKNSDLYGPWKRANLSKEGSSRVNQCITPSRFNDQYLTNVLLKINAKLGGINALIPVRISSLMLLNSRVPTLIVGMYLSRGPPGCSDVPSVAAVVSSVEWPSICRYRAAVRTQSPKLEIIDSLFNKVSDSEDKGIFREVLDKFYRSSKGKKPARIIIFRDGVSESQFNQVLNIELEQIIEACKFLDETWSPKFTVVVAQKNHHTRFFQVDSSDNVPPGTVIDNSICDPRTNDFYMCAHAGMIGTTRPTHYHVLLDEIGFSVNELQALVHSLSYVNQRSTTAISVVAPIHYAHLAAAHMSKFIKCDDESSSSGVPQLPELRFVTEDTMFFC